MFKIKVNICYEKHHDGFGSCFDVFVDCKG